MRKILYYAIFLTTFMTGSVFANCPPPEDITYHQHLMNGHLYGTWDPKNGWYQGSSDATATVSEGDHPTSFTKTTWFPYRDETHGATNCYYLDAHSNNVTLFQQTGYGDVPKPQGQNWYEDTFGTAKAVSCNTSTALCHFDFAE